MFNLFKKNRKDNAPSLNKSSSSSNSSSAGVDNVFSMTADEYMVAVEKGVIAHWSDKKLMEIINVNDLFAVGARVKNKKMTLDQAFDAVKRANRMIEMCTYVMDEFCERSKKLPHRFGQAIDENNFYSANTLCELFDEAAQKEFEYNDYVPKNVDEAVGMINSILECFGMVKKNLFFIVVNEAKVSLNKMRGFV